VLKPIRCALAIGALFLFAFSLTSRAKDNNSLGLFNSPCGFGVSYVIIDQSKNEGKTFSLVADMYGIYSGLNKTPGIYFSYIDSKIYKDYGKIGLFYGIGCAAGYVRDLEANAIPWQRAPLYNNYGVMGGVAVNWGAHFTFDHNIYLDLGLQAIGGLHFRANEDGEGIIISLYKNGLLQAICPVLKIQYRF